MSFFSLCSGNSFLHIFSQGCISFSLLPGKKGKHFESFTQGIVLAGVSQACVSQEKRETILQFLAKKSFWQFSARQKTICHFAVLSPGITFAVFSQGCVLQFLAREKKRGHFAAFSQEIDLAGVRQEKRKPLCNLWPENYFLCFSQGCILLFLDRKKDEPFCSL